MEPISATDARAVLPNLLDRVAAGEEVTITRHGKPAAVLVHPDALRTRRAAWAFAAADELRSELEAARRRPFDPQPGLEPGRADELIAEIRADRDGQ